MKTIIMYYTLGGSSRREAEKLAAECGDATLCEVKEARKRNIITAFIPGCPQAMHRKVPRIQEIPYDLAEFDRIAIVCPIWASYPAPAFNAIVERLPEGKEVSLYLCSGSGNSEKSKQESKDMIAQKGCILSSYNDINTAEKEKA